MKTIMKVEYPIVGVDQSVFALTMAQGGVSSETLYNLLMATFGTME